MQLPTSVPVMTLRDATLFPQALLPLYIFEPRYRQMLADTLKSHRMFSVAMQKPGRTREAPCVVAGLGLIRVSVDHQDGTSHLILQGLTRVELQETVQTKPYRVQRICPIQAQPDDNVVIDALVAKVHELAEQRVNLGSMPFPFPVVEKSLLAKGKKAVDYPSSITPKEILDYLEKLPDADMLADLVSCALLPGAAERQKILETVDLETRLKQLVRFLMIEIERCREGGK